MKDLECANLFNEHSFDDLATRLNELKDESENFMAMRLKVELRAKDHAFNSLIEKSLFEMSNNYYDYTTKY
jgi:hypothetical protein